MTRPSSKSLPGGTETVLLVEPQPEARTLGAFMLTRLGYNVLEARGGADALRIFEEYTEGVDLLLTEALMPQINGHELSEMLLQRDPALKVLFLSDREYEGLAHRVAVQKGLAFLVRPFTMASLADRVRQVLDGRARTRWAAAFSFLS